MRILYFENIKITNYFNPQKNSNKKSLLDILILIKNQNLHTNIELYWNNEHDLWNALYEYTQLIEAAGGVVCNEKQELLLIYRSHHWDLPKGKREHNEELITNAKREIGEETHVGQLIYHKDLDITYHLYYMENTCVLKKTYWYVFRSSHNDILKPQKEEGIEEVKWVAPKNILEYCDSMFLLIRELVEKYLKVDD